MIVKNEPYLIEYNVRMGDPECQTILPLLKSDFGKIIKSCCEQKLNLQNIEWYNKKVCVLYYVQKVIQANMIKKLK